MLTTISPGKASDTHNVFTRVVWTKVFCQWLGHMILHILETKRKKGSTKNIDLIKPESSPARMAENIRHVHLLEINVS